VDVDARRIDAVLDAEGLSGLATFLEPLRQFFFRDNLFDAAANDRQLIRDCGKRRHDSLILMQKRCIAAIRECDASHRRTNALGRFGGSQ